MKLRLSTRLITLFVLLGLVPFLIIGVYAYQASHTALSSSVEQRLAFIRENKREQITEYMQTLGKLVKTIAANPTTISAMEDLSGAFAQVEADQKAEFATNHAEKIEILRNRYLYQQKHTANAPENAIDLWWPRREAARILQYHYVAANSNPIGEKHKLIAAADGSHYSALHRRYHPTFAGLLSEFGFYDMFLIEPDSGTIVYTVFKELDFTTSLVDGPYAKTAFAKAFRAAAKSNQRDAVFMVDFERYAPSYNAAASFITAPIFDGDRLVGVLAIQVPLDKIDAIMTNSGQWSANGLGRTGESFLIGPDYLMRSNPRSLIENPEGFLKQMKDLGVGDEVLAPMREQKLASGNLSYRTPPVERALAGESGMARVEDYRQQPVLMAYGPLDVLGLRWALAATMEVSEAFAMVDGLSRTLWIFGAVLILVVLAVGWFFARSISRPLVGTIGVLSTSSAEIAATVAQQERITNLQATATTETNTTMEELGVSARQSADQAVSVAHGIKHVQELATAGTGQTERMMEAMNHLKAKVEAIARQILTLSEQTGQINSITELVTGFATETKMLAMNAAVEAVRAGEHGKGLSVLAMEVRKLADESTRSAERISALVQDVQKTTNSTVMATEEGTKKVEQSLQLARETTVTFMAVADSLNDASEGTQQIYLNVREQAEAVRQVVQAMNDLKIGASETAIGLSQTKEGIQSLNGAAQQLKAMVAG